MTQTSGHTNKHAVRASFPFIIAAIAALIFFAASAMISYGNMREVRRNTEWVLHTDAVLMGLEEVIALVRDAETGSRGYVITANEIYLEPYLSAIEILGDRIESVRKMTLDNAEQVHRLDEIKKTVDARIAELSIVNELVAAEGFEAARARMLSNRGREYMRGLRSMINEMQSIEVGLRDSRTTEMDNAYKTAVVSTIITCLLGLILTWAVIVLTNRSSLIRRREEWLKNGQLGLSSALAGEQSVDSLGENMLRFLAAYTNAQAGAVFTGIGNEYRRTATYGVPADAEIPNSLRAGDGLLGQAVSERKPLFVENVPENYLVMGSALGQATPRYLVISPSVTDGNVNGVFELGYLGKPPAEILELLEEAAELIGVAVRSAKYRTELQNLLEETQKQAEELQAQGEELRVSNEELEEQSRALKESQSRLEQQQAELEQSNAQLEEQTQQLETQRDDLARAQVDLQSRTTDLERASQYKSDFLANMSHELRTPLNSSLILAKLLGDNAKGNLTAEQVQFARTIESSGNDLLALINDILDLSKIEAGHMDIHPENVPVEWVTKDLNNIFQPIAGQRDLGFKITLDKTAPKSIETDRQRLEQILKNLLSNAFKFTPKGDVELKISGIGKDRVALAVRDTGIGISNDDQRAVFEAFRQADGTNSRKYGGTGLGLSISRELARLLGGRIELSSELGKGSVFTLVLPLVYDGSQIEPAIAPRVKASSVPAEIKDEPAIKEAVVRTHRLHDDRDNLQNNKRVIMVVEDDESFAKIIYDLAHEMDFQCLIAGTAEEALTICKQYLPSAIVLDVGLPDNSGLSVLDRLKRNPKTRHIPVHVVSADDYTETALALGAIGYMLKPVKREQLEDAFRNLENRLSSTMRRVLVVEDDKVQRESVIKLLDTRNVEAVAVGTAADCLKKLKKETFDCMILDLSLPDASGYTLLETLSQDDEHAFPPVIVYTGKDLSNEDEQRLRRYSKSIIIKGAKSPERLLDEVTLFLHQVVSDLPKEHQEMLEKARHRDSILEGRRILVVEDDIRNVYAVTNIFEPLGAEIQIARNGREALEVLEAAQKSPDKAINLVLMDVMMPEMDGLTATREIRKNKQWQKLPIIMLTAKAMRDDQERCIAAGANDYMAKPLDVEKLVSLVRVWMPR